MRKTLDTLSVLTLSLALAGAVTAAVLRPTEPDPRALDDAHAQAMAQWRAHQYAAAYGRLMKLADAGHAASAQAALLMLRNGKALVGVEWSATAAQQRHWSGLVAGSAPGMRGVVDNEAGD